MPEWAQWVTFGIALVGAGLGIANLWMSYIRGAVRLRLKFKFHRVPNEHTRFRIRAENTGRVAVSIDKVGLARWPGPFAKPVWLRREPGEPDRLELAPGKAATWTVDPEAFSDPVVLKRLVVVAQTEDGRRVQRRCARLRQYRTDLQPAPMTADATPWNPGRQVKATLHQGDADYH
jgi:hypothetical protein